MPKKFTSEDYRKSLLKDLHEIYQGLQSTKYLSQVFDLEWHDRIHDEISKYDLSNDNYKSSIAFMFFQLAFPHRGVEWFEKIQKKVIEGKIETLTEDQKFALGWTGLDPLVELVPLLERRLTAFMEFPRKQEIIKAKFEQLKANKFSINFRNHFFEMQVLGYFALKNVLEDIEVEVNGHPSTIDGLIRLDDRAVFVEVTFTSQEHIDTSNGGVIWADWYEMFESVKEKIKKKIQSGKQLGLVQNAPCILVIGRNYNSADAIHTKEAATDAFSSDDFSQLSALISGGSWRFKDAEKFVNQKAIVALTDKEIENLTELGI